MCVFEAFLEKSLSKISFLKLFLIHHHTKITYMTLQILLKANAQSFDSCFYKLFGFFPESAASWRKPSSTICVSAAALYELIIFTNAPQTPLL